MLKLIKYEYRKDIVSYIVVLSTMVVLEAYLGLSLLLKSNVNVALASVLFVLCGWAVILFIMIMGVVSFARELNSRSSYMTFMTPNSAYKIVGSKYITVLFTTLAVTALYGFFWYIDMNVAMVRYNDIKNIGDMIDMVLKMADTSLANIFASIAAMVVNIWISIFTTVSIAYFAVTLSCTVLANSKGKGWLAFGFFIVIRIILSVVTNFLPGFSYGYDMWALVLGQWPTLLMELVFVLGSYFGVSVMLDKKVSL